jgi:hypothetical protein
LPLVLQEEFAGILEFPSVQPCIFQSIKLLLKTGRLDNFSGQYCPVLGYDQINGRGFVTPQPAAADAHNRSAYQSRVYEEDQLEIPAFLRRQSS